MKNAVNPETLELYRSQLPYGTMMLVAKKAKVSRQAVSAFLTGRSYSRHIELSTIDVIAELRKERDNKLRAAGLL